MAGVGGREAVVQRRTSVLVVDDDALVRRWLRLIFDAQDDLETVREAADGLTAVSLVADLRPDVTVLDVQMMPLQSASRRPGAS
ncbi:MAG: response regulator transcription factor [Acidimicrobiales bacterium]